MPKRNLSSIRVSGAGATLGKTTFTTQSKNVGNIGKNIQPKGRAKKPAKHTRANTKIPDAIWQAFPPLRPGGGRLGKFNLSPIILFIRAAR